MVLLLLLALAVQAPAAEPPGAAATLAAEIRNATLDPDTCYRIRDLDLSKEDIRLFLTDGYLMFSKPIRGRRLTAIFVGPESNDDAEIIVRPPNRAERESLASHSGSPNLNEHFRSAVMIFTDGTGERLLASIRNSENPKPAPDMALLLTERLKDVVKNLNSSFQMRLAHDILNAAGPEQGLFYAAIAGTKTINFDVIYDPVLRERVAVGAMTSPGQGSPSGFDVWTSFESRSQRQGKVGFEDDVSLDRFQIDATLEPDLRLKAVTRVSVTPRRRVAGALAFQISHNMEVTSASLDGARLEVLRKESLRDNAIRGGANDPFLIALPAPLEAGKTYLFEIRHQGQVIRAAGNDVYYVAARSNWYPSRGIPFSLYDLTFRAPKDLTVVATGELVEEKVEGEVRVTRRVTKTKVPFVAFNLGYYNKTSLQRGPYHVDVYANRRVEPALVERGPAILATPPGLRRSPPVAVTVVNPPPDPAARLRGLAAEIAGAMEWMTQVFGPAPIEYLTVSPIPGNFGLGFAGLIYLPTISFVSPDSLPSYARSNYARLFYGEILQAHETAHQWWGNLVMPASYHDDWLQEALASYSALMFLEKRKGVRALEQALDESKFNLLRPYQQYKTAESAGAISQGTRLSNAGQGEPWRSIIYDKGSWVIHMLRRRMGDAAFQSLLKDVCARFRYQQISTGQFRELAARHLPKGQPDSDLEAFFDTWVYSTGVPKLDLDCRTRGKAPTITLACTLRQSDVPDDFSVDVPVEIRIPGAKPVTRWVRTSLEPAQFTVPARTPGAKAELAPGRAVLSR